MSKSSNQKLKLLYLLKIFVEKTDTEHTLIDWFGKNTIIHKADENNFVAYLTVEISPPFFGWIFQFGNKVKIVSPENVRSKLVEYIYEVKGNY